MWMYTLPLGDSRSPATRPYVSGRLILSNGDLCPSTHPTPGSPRGWWYEAQFEYVGICDGARRWAVHMAPLYDGADDD